MGGGQSVRISLFDGVTRRDVGENHPYENELIFGKVISDFCNIKLLTSSLEGKEIHCSLIYAQLIILMQRVKCSSTTFKLVSRMSFFISLSSSQTKMIKKPRPFLFVASPGSSPPPTTESGVTQKWDSRSRPKDMMIASLTFSLSSRKPTSTTSSCSWPALSGVFQRHLLC